jgi:hypothetical protein
MSGLRQTAVCVVVAVCALVSLAAAMVAWNESHRRPVAAVAESPAVVALPRLGRGDLCVASFEGERAKRWESLQGKSVLVRDDPAAYQEYNEVFTKGVQFKPGDRWVSVSVPDEPLWTDLPILRSELTPVSR